MVSQCSRNSIGAKALKKRSRFAYYALKWLLFGGLLFLVLR